MLLGNSSRVIIRTASRYVVRRLDGPSLIRCRRTYPAFVTTATVTTAPDPTFSGQSSAHPSAVSATAAVAVAAALVAAVAASLSAKIEFEKSSSKVCSLQASKSNSDIADSSVDTIQEHADQTDTTEVINWSGTHAVHVNNALYFEPESIADVERIVATCHENQQAVRPLGSALSPNGLALSEYGMMSLAHLDRIVQVDTTAKPHPTVTVQAGARVSQVIDALRPYHLTLPNLASIAEQQMGGFIQVGAHGTGRCIAPVDHYVTQLKLVTPSQGLVTLSLQDDNNDNTATNNELFHMSKVGLGCLGVVVEITMSCIPAHSLREHTFVLTRQEAKDQVDALLKQHKHMRYMWIPYTDTVVCVTNDPVNDDAKSTTPETNRSGQKQQRANNALSEQEKLQPLTDLLMQVTATAASASASATQEEPPLTLDTIKGMGFGELRDLLLAVNPLDVHHVKRCNEAEAEFWKRSQGTVVRPSDELLQFDCGGQQWVWEVCFPTGTQDVNNGNDVLFMEQLLRGIEEQSIPAHSPIEQRWSASSSSYMSPAHGSRPDGLHSWVGIINYLPSSNEAQRNAITKLFQGPYCDLMRRVGATVNATSHWAKLEAPKSTWDLVDLQLYLPTRFPIERFNEWRAKLDPHNILAGPLIDLLLGRPEAK